VGYEYSNGLRGQPCLLAAGDFTDLHTKVVRLCLADFSMLRTRGVHPTEQIRTVPQNKGPLTTNTTQNATNTTQNGNASSDKPEPATETPEPEDDIQYLWPLDRAWEAVFPTNDIGTEQEALVLAHFSDGNESS